MPKPPTIESTNNKHEIKQDKPKNSLGMFKALNNVAN